MIGYGAGRSIAGAPPLGQTLDLAAPGQLLRRLSSHVLSFEAIFALFVFSSALKASGLTSGFPVDPTLMFFALSVPVGALVILRDGIYLPGLLIVVLWLLFAAWAGLSYGWTPARNVYAMTKLRDVVIVNTWTIVAAAMIIASQRIRVYRFLLFIVILALVMMAVILPRYESFYAYVSLGGSQHHFSRMAAFGAIVSYVWFTYARVGSTTWFTSAGLFCLFVVGLFMIGARSLMVYTFVLLVLPALLGSPTPTPGKFTIHRAQLQVMVALGLLATAIALIVLTADQLPWTLRRLGNLFDFGGEGGSAGRGSRLRMRFFEQAIQAWSTSIIMGHGLASYPIVTGSLGVTDVTGRRYPHNVILEALSETGLIGGLLLIAVIFVGLRRMSPVRLRTEPVMLACAMAGLLSLFYSMVSGDFTTFDFVLLFFGLLFLRPPAEEFGGAAASGRVASMWTSPQPARAPARVAEVESGPTGG